MALGCLLQQAVSVPRCSQALGGSNSVLGGGDQSPTKACVCFEEDDASLAKCLRAPCT